ncbi:MAG: alpha-E domain-containing protein [Sphingomonadaceae bacterium]|uniref:alpha-E domain-containing protein n=1 Tax=Thermaurantiacus sp. TaxID=2820283 RepID=UPI00298ED221|nr:alpha-E domain-containing protein [Thermaurantiacus sp.]MCS6987285.1 alpha-E domain-containing protein [Sphingomonadaceae bacterium]MDW8414505.1 alpha-E domain-containing protein [Thermaurantiacus sp.]
MLSRNAANLYWLGRYVERADYLCRLLEATIRLAALPASHGGADGAWESAIRSAAVADRFAASGRRFTEADVGHFLALDPTHPGSIRSCLEMARTNARSLRTALTLETWQAINTAWLELQRFGTEETDPLTLMRLLDTVKQALLAFDGAAHRNQLREATYWFMRLGTSLERADNTARLLDHKYHILLPRTERVGGSLDYFQWTTMLRVVSANTAYRWVYRDSVKPWLVADLLILKPQMPRSLIACYEDIVFYLDRLARERGRPGPANRLALAGLQRLQATSIDELFQEGLHEFLLRFIAQNNALGDAIAEQYLF